MITNSSTLIESLRHASMWAVSAILSFVSPISFSIQSLFILFVANILVGLFADLCTGGHWEKQKITRAFFEALLIYSFIFVIFSIGTSMKNIEGALQVVATFTWVVIWYYGANINRNLIVLSPSHSQARKAFEFSYYVITFEVIKKIPFLKDYQDSLKQENTNAE